jgi:RHS repeat-associated protein
LEKTHQEYATSFFRPYTTFEHNSASGSWTYASDYENLLKQASKSGGVTVAYAYDALGRRVQRTSSTGGTTKFVYDGADVLRDLDGDGNTIADYLNGPGIDNKLRQTASGAVSYFGTDHLGTTLSLTDASGSLTSTLNYDSFGNVTGGSTSTRYAYTGRELDTDTGLIYYRARWYDSQQGRFISEDPIRFSGSINWYAYVDTARSTGLILLAGQSITTGRLIAILNSGTHRCCWRMARTYPIGLPAKRISEKIFRHFSRALHVGQITTKMLQGKAVENLTRLK